MKHSNVTSIEVELEGDNPRTLTYTVELFRKINDLRYAVGFQSDKRSIGNNIGDGWADQTDQRDVLFDHVDQFIESLDKAGLKYKLNYD
jgi:hypothetical protein